MPGFGPWRFRLAVSALALLSISNIWHEQRILDDTTTNYDIHDLQSPRSSGYRSKSNKTDQISFCLLIKDDNQILSEWIAYHYHTFNMRRLIVAIDPDSKTSPKEVLEPWHQAFGLNYTLWRDVDYMPDFFLAKNYSKVPLSIGPSVKYDYKTNTILSEWHDSSKNVSQKQIKQDLIRVNNHRYRQKTFVSQCYRQLKQEGMTWTVHIDTDEYIVINPFWWAENTENISVPTALKESAVFPTAAAAGSLANFLGHVVDEYPDEHWRPCVMIPRLLFGSKEVSDQNINNHTFNNKSRLETLRWKFHGPADNEYNGPPKSIVNVDALPINHSIFRDGAVYSIHQPLNHRYRSKDGGLNYTCSNNGPEFGPVINRPFSINHYLGSWERYVERNDARRNANIYRKKSQSGSVFNQQSLGLWWIGDWYDDFLNRHGVEKAAKVLFFP